MISTGGELVVLARGVNHFGEDKGIDALMRKYGYVRSSRVLELVDRNKDLAHNLGAAAHLIHGSSEDRFSIMYCPGSLTREESDCGRPGKSFCEIRFLRLEMVREI